MAEGRQIPHHGEAIVLRTWPFHEADLLVSLFTREQGKVKGVARHALKSRRRFGGALEPATYVRAHYTERPRVELVRLDSFEILWSPMSAAVSLERLAGLQFVAEVLEEAVPEGAREDNLFRLAMTCLTAMDEHEVWLPVTYFAVWMARLMGWWPALGHCGVCGLDLRGQDVWWSPVADGVTCADDRRAQSQRLSASSVAVAGEFTRKGLEALLENSWGASEAWDLRRCAVAVLERHLERRLRSAAQLV